MSDGMLTRIATAVADEPATRHRVAPRPPASGGNRATESTELILQADSGVSSHSFNAASGSGS